MAKDFKSVGVAIRKAIDASKARGINRGLSAGRTEMSKRLKADTGLSTKQLRPRLGIYPATQKRQTGWFYVGFKHGFEIKEFKPKEKKVKVVPQRRTRGHFSPVSFQPGRKVGRPRARVYKGTTIKVGRESRQQIDGVFPTQSNRGISLWIARKKAYTTGKYVRGKTDKRPTFSPRINVIKDSAIHHEKAVAKVINESVAKNVADNLKYRLSRLK